MDRKQAERRATEELARGAAKSVAEPQDVQRPDGPWQVRTESIAERPTERIIKR